MQLVLTGSIAIDRIMLFPDKFANVIQPDKLHVLSISVLLKELKETWGGIATNIAYTLSLLGEQPVLLGSVGRDEASRQYIQTFAVRGVDVSHVHYSQLPTATFTVMTDQADCQIGGFYPGAMSDAVSLSLAAFPKLNTFVVLSPHDPTQMARQVAECAEHGLRLFYDIGQQVVNVSAEDLQAGVAAAELLILNDYEMGTLAKKTGWGEVEICQKVKVCVVTLGEKGCVIRAHGQELSVPAAKIEKLVDPTGAGDAFRAGFLYGYVRGWEPLSCAQLGATAAAYDVEQLGAQTHHFTRNDIVRRTQENFGDFAHSL